MNTFRKISLTLLASAGCFLAYAQEATCPVVPAQDKHMCNMASIFQVLAKSLALQGDCPDLCGPDGADIDIDALHAAVAEELTAVKVKFADGFSRLNQEQKDVVVSALRKWQDLSHFTTDELLAIGYTGLNEREAFDQKFNKHFPVKPPVDKPEDILLFADTMSKTDLGSTNFNLFKRFMCACTYICCDNALLPLNSLCALAQLKSEFDGNKSAFFLLDLCEQVTKASALLFVVLNDNYYFNGWQQAFEKSGKIFAITHDVCTQLREAIDQ